MDNADLPMLKNQQSKSTNRSVHKCMLRRQIQNLNLVNPVLNSRDPQQMPQPVINKNMIFRFDIPSIDLQKSQRPTESGRGSRNQTLVKTDENNYQIPSGQVFNKAFNNGNNSARVYNSLPPDFKQFLTKNLESHTYSLPQGFNLQQNEADRAKLKEIINRHKTIKKSSGLRPNPHPTSRISSTENEKNNSVQSWHTSANLLQHKIFERTQQINRQKVDSQMESSPYLHDEPTVQGQKMVMKMKRSIKRHCKGNQKDLIIQLSQPHAELLTNHVKQLESSFTLTRDDVKQQVFSASLSPRLKSSNTTANSSQLKKTLSPGLFGSQIAIDQPKMTVQTINNSTIDSRQISDENEAKIIIPVQTQKFLPYQKRRIEKELPRNIYRTQSKETDRSDYQTLQQPVRNSLNLQSNTKYGNVDKDTKPKCETNEKISIGEILKINSGMEKPRQNVAEVYAETQRRLQPRSMQRRSTYVSHRKNQQQQQTHKEPTLSNESSPNTRNSKSAGASRHQTHSIKAVNASKQQMQLLSKMVELASQNVNKPQPTVVPECGIQVSKTEQPEQTPAQDQLMRIVSSTDPETCLQQDDTIITYLVQPMDNAGSFSPIADQPSSPKEHEGISEPWKYNETPIKALVTHHSQSPGAQSRSKSNRSSDHSHLVFGEKVQRAFLQISKKPILQAQNSFRRNYVVTQGTNAPEFSICGKSLQAEMSKIVSDSIDAFEMDGNLVSPDGKRSLKTARSKSIVHTENDETKNSAPGCSTGINSPRLFVSKPIRNISKNKANSANSDLGVESALIISQQEEQQVLQDNQVQSHNEYQQLLINNSSPHKRNDSQLSMHPVYCNANVSVISNQHSKQRNESPLRNTVSRANPSQMHWISPQIDYCGLFQKQGNNIQILSDEQDQSAQTLTKPQTKSKSLHGAIRRGNLIRKNDQIKTLQRATGRQLDSAEAQGAKNPLRIGSKQLFTDKEHQSQSPHRARQIAQLMAGSLQKPGYQIKPIITRNRNAICKDNTYKKKQQQQCYGDSQNESLKQQLSNFSQPSCKRATLYVDAESKLNTLSGHTHEGLPRIEAKQITPITKDQPSISRINYPKEKELTPQKTHPQIRSTVKYNQTQNNKNSKVSSSQNEPTGSVATLHQQSIKKLPARNFTDNFGSTGAIIRESREPTERNELKIQVTEADKGNNRSALHYMGGQQIQLSGQVQMLEPDHSSINSQELKQTRQALTRAVVSQRQEQNS